MDIDDRIALVAALAVAPAPERWPRAPLDAAARGHRRYHVTIVAVLLGAGVLVQLVPPWLVVPFAFAGCIAVVRQAVSGYALECANALVGPLGLHVDRVYTVSATLLVPRPTASGTLRVTGRRHGRTVEISIPPDSPTQATAVSCAAPRLEERPGAELAARLGRGDVDATGWDRVRVRCDGQAVVVQREARPVRYDHTLLGAYDWRDLWLAEEVATALERRAAGDGDRIATPGSVVQGRTSHHRRRR